MSKMMTVRIVVPCDDGVTVAMLASATQAALEGLPSTRIAIEDSTEPGPRIHWSAVDVKRGSDPEERKPPPPVRGGRKAAATET